MHQDFAPILDPKGDGVDIAVEALRSGKLVCIPTETVYGLAADATNDKAVASIFDAKERPAFNPLIIHVADESKAWDHAVSCEPARTLADKFWPGPLTLVLPRRKESNVSLLASAGLDTLALRVPAHPVAHRLLAAADFPIAAPSANRSGTISPTRVSHVAGNFADSIAGVVDGGPCQIGLESTVVGFDGDVPVLLRPGGIATEQLEAIVGVLLSADPDSKVVAPGMMKRHYAPNSTLRLDATDVRPGEVMLGFGQQMPPDAPRHSLNLSKTGDLDECAANFFAMLRELDDIGATGIAVMSIPETGLGKAVNDRLRRAVTPDQV